MVGMEPFAGRAHILRLSWRRGFAISTMLRRTTIIIGVVFFALAAVCEFEAASYAHSRAANFRKFLAQPSVTPDAIRQGMVMATEDRGTADWCFYAGLGLMMLGLGCFLLGSWPVGSSASDEQ